MSAAVIALATILAIVILVASAVISLLYIRLHQIPVDSERGPHWRQLMIPSFAKCSLHPAPQVTSLGPSQPRPMILYREPGTNMRTAHRRLDGGWDFCDETPDIATCFRSQEALEFATPSLSSAPTTPSACNSSFPGTKGQGTRRHANLEVIAPPPPAYSREGTTSSIDSH